MNEATHGNGKETHKPSPKEHVSGRMCAQVSYRHDSQTIYLRAQYVLKRPPKKGATDSYPPVPAKKIMSPMHPHRTGSCELSTATAAAQRPRQVKNVSCFRDATVALPANVSRQHGEAFSEGESVGLALHPGSPVLNPVEVFHVGDAHHPADHLHPCEPQRVLGYKSHVSGCDVGARVAGREEV